MDSYQACAIIEGFDGQPHTHEEGVEAMQFLINSGAAWTLQGFYGRLAMSLIETGECHVATRKGRRIKWEK